MDDSRKAAQHAARDRVRRDADQLRARRPDYVSDPQATIDAIDLALWTNDQVLHRSGPSANPRDANLARAGRG